MSLKTPLIFVEDHYDDLWICLPIRHKDFAFKIMKMIENNNRSEWQNFIDIFVNFGVGIAETPYEAEKDFEHSCEQSYEFGSVYSINLFDKIVAKKTQAEMRKLAIQFGK